MRSHIARRASKGWARGRQAGAVLAVLAAAAAVPVVTTAAQAQTGGGALTDPPANVPRTEAMQQACGLGGAPQCQQAVVQAIDVARAAEGVGPLVLPSYYDSLDVAEQILVVTDLERVDRGLAGFVGLSSKLDVSARAAALSNSDPNGPSGATWGSNWAGGEGSALLADYDWLYDDGPGSPNMDCTGPAANGCWDHRRNVLGDYGPHPAMGAASTMVNGVTSMTELLSSGPPGQLDYALPSAAVPQVVTPSSLVIGTAPRQPNSAVLTVRDGAGAFRASATISGDKGRWSVTPLCTASVGAPCRLVVNFAPVQSGPATGTVTVDLPGRRQQVRVSAYAGPGYWEATAGGDILAFAGGGFRGSAASLRLAKPVTGMVATPDGGGYWEVAADGGVFSFGDAHFYGSAAELHVGQPFIGMASAPGGRGYWLATGDGGIYSFGDARFYGAPVGPVGEIVGIAATKDGRGYWLVSQDGRVYPFGDAKFYGAPAAGAVGAQIAAQVVGMAVARDGHGYWLVTRSGTVFGYGDSKYEGSAAGGGVDDFVGISVPMAGPGYYLVGTNGAVEAFGGAPAQGSAVNTALKSLVVGMATT